MIAAILITCFNRKEITLKSLFSLDKAINNYKNCQFDIYLVDDGSTDGTGEKVRKEFPFINVIQGNGNLYWGGGTNLAWKTAFETKDYDYYIWFNDDGILYENSFTLLFEPILENDNIIVGGAFKSKYSDKSTYGGRISDSTLFLIPNGSINQEFKFLNGNLVLIPRRVFMKIKYIDKRFKHSAGDYDYGLRALKHNIKLVLSKEFIGTCERHDIKSYKRSPFLKRIKRLYSPLGPNPFYHFIYYYRYFGVLFAIQQFISQNLNCFFPQLLRKIRVSRYR